MAEETGTVDTMIMVGLVDTLFTCLQVVHQLPMRQNYVRHLFLTHIPRREWPPPDSSPPREGSNDLQTLERTMLEVSPVSHVDEFGVGLDGVLDEGLDARLPAGEDALAVVRWVVRREVCGL